MGGRFKILFFCLFLTSVVVTPGGIRASDGVEDVADTVRTARTAGVPDPVLSRLTALGVDEGLEPGEVVGLLDVMMAARREGAPVERFLAKVEEGLAKRVPVSGILAVLHRKLEDYRFARRLIVEVIQPKTKAKLIEPDDLATLTDSMDMGLSRDEIRDFLVKAPSAPRPMIMVAVENKALLKQAGFKQELTDRILTAGLKKRRFEPEWRYLSRLVVAARDKGLTDRKITESVLATIEEGGSVRDLMADLGFTDRNVREGPVIGGSPQGNNSEN